MIRWIVAVGCALVALAAFLLTPTTIGADLRRAAAVAAVQAGAAPLGVALLRPLARAGDTVAQNDLGVLLNRGIGAVRDPAEAARLLNAAADAGLKRAQMNLVLIRMPCDTQFRDQAMVRLEAFARDGDRRAASFVADCLTWSSGLLDAAEATRRLLAAAQIAAGAGDPDEELKLGWLLLERVKRLKGSWGIDEALVQSTARAAADYLFRAAAHGRAAAYEGIGLLARDSLALLGSDPLAAKVAAKPPLGWTETAAQAGHPRSRCVFGVHLATEMASNRLATDSANRRRLAELLDTCLRSRNPRQVIFKDGESRTIGDDPLFDIWMREDPFLVASPRYENHDHDIVGREDAIYKMVRLMQGK